MMLWLLSFVAVYFFADLGVEATPFHSGVDLDHCAELRARKYASDCGNKLKWWDLYGRQPHLKQQYPDKKISVRAENIKYGTISRKVDKPGYTYTQWFHNGGSLPIKGILHKTKSVTSEFKWSITESLKLGAEVSIDAGIPEVIEGNIKISTELNLASNQEKSSLETDTFKVSHEISIPPKTRVKATMTITETEVEVPWTADMYVTGWLALWLETKCRGHWLWFLPIEQVASCDARLQAVLTPWGDSGIRYVAKGFFKGVRALRASVHKQEFPM